MNLKRQVVYVIINTLTIPLAFYSILDISDYFGAMVPVITYFLQAVISYFVFYKCFKKARIHPGKSFLILIRIAIACIIWSIAVSFEPAFISTVGTLTSPVGPYRAWFNFPLKYAVFQLVYSATFLTVAVVVSHLIYIGLLKWEDEV
ncbi:MAG: hypothetical protein H6Q72_1391 [Firmicutes bacterium]|nr:hypothetical protein [Bacillota bacterium]